METGLNSLQSIDYAVLALVGSSDRGLSQYDLKAQIEAGTAPLLGVGTTRARSSLLALADHGYLVSHQVGPDDKPKRRTATRYTITLYGRTALESWAETACKPPPVNTSELLVRLRAAQVVGLKSTIRSLGWLSENLWLELEQLEKERSRSNNDSSVRLEYDLQHALLWTYLQWLDRVEGEVLADALSNRREARRTTEAEAAEQERRQSRPGRARDE